MMSGSRQRILALALLLLAYPGLARGQTASEPEGELEVLVTEEGSRVTFDPLSAGDVGMRLGGGLAGILPYVLAEVGVGVGGDVDLGLEYVGVIGLAHIFGLDARWSPLSVGNWQFGARLSVDYVLFGFQGEKLNLTSTLYLAPEIGASVTVSDYTELVMWFACEIDVLEHRVVDDEDRNEGTFRYDATIIGIGVQTDVNDDLNFFTRLSIRIPTEAFTFEDTPLLLLPFLEGGASWSF